MSNNPLYVSKKGGTINCFRGDAGWLYLVCSDHLYLYCNDWTAAKVQLDRLERLKNRSGQMNLQAMQKAGQALRKLVEAAAAPYLEQEVA